LTNDFSCQRFLSPILYLSLSNNLQRKKIIKVSTPQFFEIRKLSNIHTTNITLLYSIVISPNINSDVKNDTSSLILCWNISLYLYHRSSGSLYYLYISDYRSINSTLLILGPIEIMQHEESPLVMPKQETKTATPGENDWQKSTFNFNGSFIRWELSQFT
jgi:hypothetical protein